MRAFFGARGCSRPSSSIQQDALPQEHTNSMAKRRNPSESSVPQHHLLRADHEHAFLAARAFKRVATRPTTPGRQDEGTFLFARHVLLKNAIHAMFVTSCGPVLLASGDMPLLSWNKHSISVGDVATAVKCKIPGAQSPAKVSCKPRRHFSFEYGFVARLRCVCCWQKCLKGLLTAMTDGSSTQIKPSIQESSCE